MIKCCNIYLQDFHCKIIADVSVCNINIKTFNNIAERIKKYHNKMKDEQLEIEITEQNLGYRTKQNTVFEF